MNCLQKRSWGEKECFEDRAILFIALCHVPLEAKTGL